MLGMVRVAVKLPPNGKLIAVLQRAACLQCLFRTVISHVGERVIVYEVFEAKTGCIWCFQIDFASVVCVVARVSRFGERSRLPPHNQVSEQCFC